MPCNTCAPELGFNILQPLDGVPVGRFVTPLVRINAKVDEMKPGQVLPPQFLPTAAIADAIQAINLADTAYLDALKAALAARP